MISMNLPLRFVMLLMLSSFFCTAAIAADPANRFTARMYRDPAGGALPYRLLIPKNYDPNRKYPLVIFFHGAGERGIDNRKQLVHGMSDFASDEIMERYPALVVAPPCPADQQWVDTPWSADAHAMPDEPTAPMRQSLELLTALEREFSIDDHRIYATGLSMGGFGVWDAVQRQPKRFAAAVPVCGGGDVAQASRMVSVPVWAFHGADDTVVKPKRSRDMIAALQAAGGKPKYTEFPGVGHNSWSATYRDAAMYEWLFSQRRP
jgi:predicted peptidase